MAKKNGNGKPMEEVLWDSANKLRGTVESSEYKHVVLGLIFLKFASDKFEERRQELIDEGKEKFLEMTEFYTMKNVFSLVMKDLIQKNIGQVCVVLNDNKIYRDQYGYGYGYYSKESKRKWKTMEKKAIRNSSRSEGSDIRNHS